MEVARSIGRLRQLKKRDVNTVIAVMVSFMLNGVPPIVCETVLDEMVSSIKKKMAVH